MKRNFSPTDLIIFIVGLAIVIGIVFQFNKKKNKLGQAAKFQTVNDNQEKTATRAEPMAVNPKKAAETNSAKILTPQS